MRDGLESLARQRGARLWCLVFVHVGVVYSLTATYGPSQIWDTFSTAAQAHQIALTGSPVVSNLEGMPPQVVPGRDGDVTNRLPGAVGVGVLAYGLARPLIPAAAEHTRANEIPLWPAGLAGAMMTAAAVATLAVAMREWEAVPPGTGLMAVGVFAFGTATWSVSADALWTHAVTQLGLAVAIHGLVVGRYGRTGLGFALSILGRTHTALVAGAAGLAEGWNRRQLTPVVVIGSLSVAGLGLAVLYGVWVFGVPSVSVGYSGYSSRVISGGVQASRWATFGNIALLFVHPVRGLLLTTPFLIPLLFGLPTAWRQAPWWVRGLAVGALAQLVVQGLVNPYTGGDTFFGSRLTIEFLTGTAPLWLLAYVVGGHERPRLRQWTHVTAAAAILVHAAGATFMSRGVLP